MKGGETKVLEERVEPLTNPALLLRSDKSHYNIAFPDLRSRGIQPPKNLCNIFKFVINNYLVQRNRFDPLHRLQLFVDLSETS